MPHTVKKFMDKRLLINVQGGRKVTGILRGFDIFLNLVLDEGRDETYAGQEQDMYGGSIVRCC
jgi:small nuclear ribonucleoprotein G